jgi:hypothetical protein
MVAAVSMTADRLTTLETTGAGKCLCAEQPGQASVSAPLPLHETDIPFVPTGVYHQRWSARENCEESLGGEP